MRHIATRHKATTKRARPGFGKAFLYYGIFARVARRLGLGENGRSHVRRVALGLRNSRRVLEALRAEIERIEKRAA